MAGLILSKKERCVIEELIGHTTDPRSLRRAYALLWRDEGQTYPEIARQLNVSRQTVYNWVERFLERADCDISTRLADPHLAVGQVRPTERAASDCPGDH